ncbi:MAG: hypothetical protein AB7S44_01780 [Spirochaetales bacterium]
MEKNVNNAFEKYSSNTIDGKTRLKFRPDYEPLVKNVSTQIISAFPMSGKTTSSRTFNLISHQMAYGFEKDILDVHLGEFLWIDKENRIQNPKFPKNYVDFVENNMGKYLCIFISSNKEVCEEMAKRRIDYTIVYPATSLKQDILEQIKYSPNRSQKFYDWYNTNFEGELERIKKDTFPKKMELKTNHEFLTEFPNIINSLIEETLKSNVKSDADRGIVKHQLRLKKINSKNRGKVPVFAVHDDDHERGEKFTQFLRENLKTLSEYGFIYYNTLSVRPSEYEKALALGREYFKKTVGTEDELKYTVEVNYYSERRPINSTSLFGIKYKPFEENRNSEDAKRYGLAYMLEEYIDGAEFRVLKNLYKQLGLNPKNLYTNYGMIDNSLEVLYMDLAGEFDSDELKQKVDRWLIEEGGMDKLLTEDKRIDCFIETKSNGKFLNLLLIKDKPKHEDSIEHSA